MGRIGRQDLQEFIADAYRRTAERIAAGEISDEGTLARGSNPYCLEKSAGRRHFNVSRRG